MTSEQLDRAVDVQRRAVHQIQQETEDATLLQKGLLLTDTYFENAGTKGMMWHGADSGKPYTVNPGQVLLARRGSPPPAGMRKLREDEVGEALDIELLAKLRRGAERIEAAEAAIEGVEMEISDTKSKIAELEAFVRSMESEGLDEARKRLDAAKAGFEGLLEGRSESVRERARAIVQKADG